MWYELLKSSIEKNFNEVLRETISKLGKNTKDFAKESGIPESTLYKIMSNSKKDFRISTLKQIIKTVKRLEGHPEGNVIGIVTGRGALDMIGKKLKIKGDEIQIKEYPATSIEEEIIQGIRAQREGVSGIVCGPLAATTLEKIVNIPVSSLKFEEGPIKNSIERLAKKI